MMGCLHPAGEWVQFAPASHSSEGDGSLAFEIAPADYAKIDDYIDRLLAAHADGSLTLADVHWELT